MDVPDVVAVVYLMPKVLFFFFPPRSHLSFSFIAVPDSWKLNSVPNKVRLSLGGFTWHENKEKMPPNKTMQEVFGK